MAYCHWGVDDLINDLTIESDTGHHLQLLKYFVIQR